MLFSLIYFGVLILVGVCCPRTDRFGHTHPKLLWERKKTRSRDARSSSRRARP